MSEKNGASHNGIHNNGASNSLASLAKAEKPEKKPDLLDPGAVKLWLLEDGSMVMKHAGRKVLLGPPRRALPLSDPDHFIVFNDEDGNEVGILASLDELDEASQAALRESLSNEYRLERITRVLDVDREPLSGQTRWRVEIAVEEAAEASGPEASSETTTEVEGSLAALEQSETEEESGDGTFKRAGARVANFLSLSRDKEKSEDSTSVVEREFSISGQEDVQTARYPHIFIVDTERRRYEIANCEELDIESRRLAERFF
jgi:hypothetical protein